MSTFLFHKTGISSNDQELFMSLLKAVKVIQTPKFIAWINDRV